MTEIVWVNGQLLDPTSAGLHWSDHGITVGDGVFETIKLNGNRPFALRRHLDRLEFSAAGLRIASPQRVDVESAVREVAGRWGEMSRSAVGRLRLTLTSGRGPMGSGRGNSGPTLMVTAGAMSLTREPTPVLVVPFARNERGALAGLKTTSYAENVLALALAAESGASEAIFANTRGELCEGTGTNVFLEFNGRLVTPPLHSGCLAGVTRALLCEALSRTGQPAVEADLQVDALSHSTEAFLVSTAREVQPISAVGGTSLAQSCGPLTRAAMDAWDTLVAPHDDP